MVLPVSYHVDWLTIPACQWYGHIEIVFCQMICLAQVERLYETLIKQPEVQQSPKRASAIKTTEYEGVSNVGRRHLTSIAYSESGESCLRLCLLWSIRRGSLRFAECIMAQMQVHNLRLKPIRLQIHRDVACRHQSIKRRLQWQDTPYVRLIPASKYYQEYATLNTSAPKRVILVIGGNR